MVCNGAIPIENIAVANGKCPTLPKTVNVNTNKESTISITFNDDGWGAVTRGFTLSAFKKAQSIHKFEKIKRATKEFSKGSTHPLESLSTEAPEDPFNDLDERAHFVDNDSDDNNNSD